MEAVVLRGEEPRSVAMELSRHKTESIFRRYGRRSLVVRAPLVAIEHHPNRPEEVARWARDQVRGTA